MHILKKIEKRLVELKAEYGRANKAARWHKRIEKISSRSVDPKSERKFCDENGIDPAQFSRFKNGVTSPSEENFKKIEAAFASEGV